jgi:trypsin
MFQRSARLLFLAALLTLALPATASASVVERHAPPAKPKPRIVGGGPASPGEYPAQGFLAIDVDNNTSNGYEGRCGGTLVGTRQFLTAAHCVTVGNTPTDPGVFLVVLGTTTPFVASPSRQVFEVADNDVNVLWNRSTFRNDTAMLTLADPALDFEPMRVAGTDETSIWEPGDLMRIIGWGRTTEGGSISNSLLEADVPIVTDTSCDSDYGGDIDPSVMVCAGDGQHDTCQGDSGGPLLATDDNGFYALVGTVSFGQGCAEPDFPGIYARVGDDPLNDWVNDRTPLSSFDLDHAAVATQPVTLFSTSTHPDGPSGFDTFKWDFDQDGQFDDATGASRVETFPEAGERIIGLEASGPSGDRAVFYGAFDVAGPPTDDGDGDDTTPPPATTSTTPPSGGGQTPPPPVVVRFATLKSPKSLRARKGSFNVKVSFAASAPAGTAVVNVLLKGKRIGSGRVKVKPGGTATAKVKLTKAGLRKLKKAKKLKVTLRIAVGGKTTTKALTIKR